MVELCCGSAVLSASAAAAGLRAFPVDHTSNKFTLFLAPLNVDLGSPEGRTWATALISLVRPVWLHVGMPCGTGSRARDRPVPRRLLAEGAPAPRPLRSALHPLGLPGLTMHEQHRVSQANAVYETVVHVLHCASQRNSTVSLEKPSRSSIWSVLATLVVRYAREHDAPAFADWYFALRSVQFHSCMHGSERAKDTRLRCTPAVLQALQTSCDNSHRHAPWGINRAMHGWSFDTLLEAQYPRLLARRMVQCVVRALSPAVLSSTSKALQLDKLAALSHQKPVAPMLIPEFKSFTWVPDGQHAPKHARLVPHRLQSDCQVAPVPTWPVSLQSPSMPAPQASSPPAEKHAWTIFASGSADMDSLWFLSTLLPAESYRPLPQGSASWLTGTQWFQGKCSPRPEVQEYPWCSHLLAQVFRTLAPDCVCTTLPGAASSPAPRHYECPRILQRPGPSQHVPARPRVGSPCVRSCSVP